MMDLTRRRLLALGGNAAALGMLGGCESFSQSALLRSPVYDTSEADRASNSAAAAEPPAGGPRPELPLLEARPLGLRYCLTEFHLGQ